MLFTTPVDGSNVGLTSPNRPKGVSFEGLSFPGVPLILSFHKFDLRIGMGKFLSFARNTSRRPINEKNKLWISFGEKFIAMFKELLYICKYIESVELGLLPTLVRALRNSSADLPSGVQTPRKLSQSGGQFPGLGSAVMAHANSAWTNRWGLVRADLCGSGLRSAVSSAHPRAFLLGFVPGDKVPSC